MPSRIALPLLLGSLLALAACGRAPESDADAGADPLAQAPAETVDAPDPSAEAFERTWLGVLPCADCDGIQARLQLVRDGERQTYTLEETYLGVDGEAVFAQDGRWIEEAGGDEGETYRLDPGTPASRAYRLRPDGALDLLDRGGRPVDAGGQYRLQRL